MAKKLIGVDLGGTTIKFAILTENGEIQQKWSLRTNILDDGSHIVPDIINSINHHLDLYKMSRDQFIGIGMGTPGTIDREKGTVIGAYNLNWKTTQNVKGAWRNRSRPKQSSVRPAGQYGASDSGKDAPTGAQSDRRAWSPRARVHTRETARCKTPQTGMQTPPQEFQASNDRRESNQTAFCSPTKSF